MSTVVAKRERAVLALLCQGFATKEIAEALKIPAHTIKKDVSVLLHRYNAKNRVDLVIGRWKEAHAKLGKTI